MGLSMSTSQRTAIADPASFGRVALLQGGTSAEREISLMTGNAVYEALRRRDVDVQQVDPAEGLLEQLPPGKFHRVWNALHGRGGEDGCLQGVLEHLNLPYTGSGVLGSAISMDKLRSKQLMLGVGLATADFVVLQDATDFSSAIDQLGLPLIVKPAAEGSSLGLSKVNRSDELPAAFDVARQYECAVFAERWLTGGEYSAAVLQGEVLPLIRIDAADSFYDYEAKYFTDQTRYVCPCGLSSAQEKSFSLLCQRAFDAVGASGWGRVDFMLDAEGQARILEVNTVPGMTDHSLVPMSAQATGIEFDELVWRILETSFEVQH